MEHDIIHDPDEEQQQEFPQDVTRRPVRIGPGGDLEPAEPEDPSEAPPHGPKLPQRGTQPCRPNVNWRPHDRGFDRD